MGNFMSEDDSTLLLLAANGDKTAFEQVYRRYSGKVYAIALRLLAQRPRAEEAVQETFIRVWQQLPTFRGDSQFATWLHRIAVGCATDLWRKDKPLRLTENEPITELSYHPEDEQLAHLDSLILRLPPQARAVFVLFAIEGYQHQEIAALLQIAPGSSKAQYHRARQLLQEWLDEQV